MTQHMASRADYPKRTTSTHRVKKRSFMAYCRTLVTALTNSFASLSANPLATCMTLAVISIALALPSGLLVMLKNVESITHGWNSGARISLYMKGDITADQAKQIADVLRGESGIAKVDYISPSSGLKEFEKYSGFKNVLSQLTNNPLPSVIMIQPSNQLSTPLQISQLLDKLKAMPQVDVAELDMQWVKRLYSFIALGERIVYGLALLLALGVVMIIGNTIRLITQNKRDEIEVLKLIGATDSYIRRPFLLTGIVYGVIGAIFAMVLVDSFLSWIANPVMELSDLYDSTFRLAGLSNGQTESLLLVGAILGFAGSWLAVSKHLKDFDPK